MLRRLYIPKRVKAAIADHFAGAIQRAVNGFLSAHEDEDTLTGHLGALLQIGNQRVLVEQDEIPGEWTWSIDYHKFRGRGRGATESMLGADGIIELRLYIGDREEVKSLLFQAKNDWKSDYSLQEQCVKMSTWREAAFVINYTPHVYEAYTLDEILRSRGVKSKQASHRPLSDLLSRDFLDCLIGDTDLSYDARSRTLVWRAVSGEIVATSFAVKHRVRVDVKAPRRFRRDHIDKHIPNVEIYKYRMEASAEEILSLESQSTKQELKTARNNLALVYHPDKYDGKDDLIKQILNKRMQEINEAYKRVRAKHERQREA